jgi:protein ImuA
MRTSAVIHQLRRQIACLEERQRRFAHAVPVADGVDRWLPFGGLSAGCIHEVKGSSLSHALAFSAILSSRIADEQGNILCVAPDRSLHPLGLLPFGVKLNQVLHVVTKRPQDLAWAVMEGLRCPQVHCVLAVMGGLNLTDSRRLQLAAEGSGATGFLLGPTASAPIAAPVSRWKISSAAHSPARRFDEPMWTVDLLYCRGGRPGQWTLEWRDAALNLVTQPRKQQLIKPGRTALAG